MVKVLTTTIFGGNRTEDIGNSNCRVKNVNYMKTKKALGGLLGLLGSFAAFPLLVFFPALVAAPPFLFTASLPSHDTRFYQFRKYKQISYKSI